MIKIQNLFQMTKSCTVDRKEYVFRAFEVKEVPESFLNPNGQLKFPGFKIVVPEVARGPGRPKTKKTAEVLDREIVEKMKPDDLIYLMENEEKNELVHVADIDFFCARRRYIKRHMMTAFKEKRTYFGWKCEVITAEEYTKRFLMTVESEV